MVIEMAKKVTNSKGKYRKYCTVITLDVKIAFNSAAWKHITSSLRKLNVSEYLIRILKDYFSIITLLFDTDDGTKSYNVTSRVPQGSVLIMCNGIFNLQTSEFADDIAVIVTGRYHYKNEVKFNESATCRLKDGSISHQWKEKERNSGDKSW